MSKYVPEPLMATTDRLLVSGAEIELHEDIREFSEVVTLSQRLSRFANVAHEAG